MPRESLAVYLNSAKYLRAGKSLWVDRIFSRAVLNGIYSFHASSSAYSDFWNHSYARDMKLSRKQVWRVFVEESIRTIASSSSTDFSVHNGLAIKDVTKAAFQVLGESGILRSADHHQCAECTHAHKATADILTGDDPAGVVGVDENRAIPALVGPDANRAIRDAQRARDRAADQAQMGDVLMDERLDHAPVRMVVLDGIVMGHQVCLIS
jgi:hypothetical protein